MNHLLQTAQLNRANRKARKTWSPCRGRQSIQHRGVARFSLPHRYPLIQVPFHRHATVGPGAIGGCSVAHREAPPPGNPTLSDRTAFNELKVTLPVVGNVKINNVTSTASPRVMFIKGFEGAVVVKIRFKNSTFNGVTSAEVLFHARKVSFDNVTINPASGYKVRNSAPPPTTTPPSVAFLPAFALRLAPRLGWPSAPVPTKVPLHPQ